MERNATNKRKILVVRDIMERCSGKENAITMTNLLSRLHLLGISAERKSVYDDLKVLREYGMPIASLRRGHATSYYVRRTESERIEKEAYGQSEKSGIY